MELRTDSRSSTVSRSAEVRKLYLATSALTGASMLIHLPMKSPWASTLPGLSAARMPPQRP